MSVFLSVTYFTKLHKKKGGANAPPFENLKKSVGVIVEVTLNVDDGGTLVTGAGGQVAQRTDQVGQAAGGGAFGGHIAHQAAIENAIRAKGDLAGSMASQGTTPAA